VASLTTSGAIFTALTGATGAVTLAAPNAVDTLNAQSIAGLKTFTTGVSATGSSSIASTYGIVPGYNGTGGTSQVYSGTGVPAFSAPAGSIFLSYNGNAYVNTSTSGTSGTSWGTLGVASAAVTSISTSGAIFTALSGATGAVTIAAPNAVDTTSTQTIGGTKTFSGTVQVAALVSTGAITPGYSGSAGTALVYSGSGTPSFSATEGSLFLSSNGSAYVNTSSGTGTTWTQLQAGSGAVTGVTATSPIVSSGGSAPVISISSSPTFSGTVTAGQFTGSGAGLTSATVPNAALVTTPLDTSSSTQTKTGALTVGEVLTASTSLVVNAGATIGSSLDVGSSATVGGSLTVIGSLTYGSMSGANISAGTVSTASTDIGWINVKDPAYGAVGNGSTDDTAAIRAAVAAGTAIANAGGQAVIFFPPAVYRMAGTGNLVTLVPNGLSIFGPGATIKVTSAATNCFYFNAGGYSSATLVLPSVLGTAPGTTTGTAVYFADSTSCANVQIGSIQNMGYAFAMVSTTAIIDHTIDFMLIQNCGVGILMQLTVGATAGIQGIIFNGNFMTSCTNTNIWLISPAASPFVQINLNKFNIGAIDGAGLSRGIIFDTANFAGSNLFCHETFFGGFTAGYSIACVNSASCSGQSFRIYGGVHNSVSTWAAYTDFMFNTQNSNDVQTIPKFAPANTGNVNSGLAAATSSNSRSTWNSGRAISFNSFTVTCPSSSYSAPFYNQTFYVYSPFVGNNVALGNLSVQIIASAGAYLFVSQVTTTSNPGEIAIVLGSGGIATAAGTATLLVTVGV
jgi:hypothetical protein